MNNITYIIPARIESNDRLRNITTSVSYLLRKFPEARVIVKEVDKEPIFSQYALPTIETIVDTKNLQYIYEKNTDDLFHKTRILNDLILEADTEIVASHDVDVVYPVESHITAYNMINSGEFDVVYPYGCGVYQYQVVYPEKLYEMFLNSNFDIRLLLGSCATQASTIGWTQFYNRNKVIEGFMWNENFISWGAEDCEFYFRLSSFGFNVGRVMSDIYHFEHGRTFNSHYHNPKFADNHNLWQRIRTWDSSKLKAYYEQQDYLKNRGEKINVSI